MDNPASTPQRPRRQFWRGAGGVALGLIGLLLVGGVGLGLYFVFSFGYRVQAKVAQLHAEGQPTTYTDLIPPPVPEDQNAAVLYQQVFQVDFSQPGQTLKAFAGLTEKERDLLTKYPREASPETDARAAALLARPEVQQALAIFEQASRRPACVFPIHWEAGNGVTFSHLARFRAATLILTAQAILESRRGQPEQAARWLAVGVRMSRHAGSEPTIIAQLVRYAMLAILWRAAESVADRPSPPGPYAAELDQALAAQNLDADFLTAMRGERAQGLGLLDQLRAESAPQSGDDEESRALRVYARSRRIAYDEETYLNFWDQALPLMAQRNREARPKLERLEQQASSGFQRAEVSAILPVTSHPMQNRDRTQANVDLWRVALALQGYKAAHGAYPASLADLQKTLKWTIPPDPFSGQPYVYRTEGAGFMVYSFGPDLKDNGGQSQYDAQGKYHEEGDIVWKCEK